MFLSSLERSILYRRFWWKGWGEVSHGLYCYSSQMRTVRPTTPSSLTIQASLLAKNDDAVSSVRIHPIQRPIHRQLREHDDLLNGQRRIALRPPQLIGEIAGQSVG